MNLLMFLLVLAVVAAIAAIVLGRMPGGMPEPSSTVPQVGLPEGTFTGADVHRLRFVPGLRGYRMDQVDEAMDRLAAEIDRLRALVPPDELAAPDGPAHDLPAHDLDARDLGSDVNGDDLRARGPGAFPGMTRMPDPADVLDSNAAGDGDR